MGARGKFVWMREATRTALCATDTHPTAEWIYERLRAEHPNVSLGTVYRNLRGLCRRGEAVSVGVIDGKERFDGRVDPHAHLVCARCGQVVDLKTGGYSKEALSVLSQQNRCVLTGASVVFRGVCGRCLEEEKKTIG